MPQPPPRPSSAGPAKEQSYTTTAAAPLPSPSSIASSDQTLPPSHSLVRTPQEQRVSFQDRPEHMTAADPSLPAQEQRVQITKITHSPAAPNPVAATEQPLDPSLPEQGQREKIIRLATHAPAAPTPVAATEQPLPAPREASTPVATHDSILSGRRKRAPKTAGSTIL